MGGGSSPPTPVPAGQVAGQQQQLNTQSGIQSQAGSSTSQFNPYGSLQYSQTGTGPGGVPIYSSSLSLNPVQQQLLDVLTGTQKSAGQQGQNLIQGANYGGQSPTDAIGNQTQGIEGGLMSGWLQSQAPWMSQATTELDTKLKNQGLNPSPTATNDPSTWGPYEKAMGQLRQSQTMGVAGAASQFQPQAFQEASSLYQLPAQLGAALAGFGQPTSPGQSLVQTPSLSISPADLIGATAQQENVQEQNYQAQIAKNNAMMSGLFNLGGNVIGGMARGSSGLFNPSTGIFG